MNRRRRVTRALLLASLSTSVLRGLLWTLATSTASRFFLELTEDIRHELLARDLPRLARAIGGHPCAGPREVQ